ncbi:MAG: hypothetical protein JWO36_6213 [Myxococcales bacterium]|nr:hypothetical protein [Myxococcales bacterium]
MKIVIEAIALLVLLPLPAWAGPFDGTWRIDSNSAQLDPKPWDQSVANGRYKCTTCDPKIDIKADGIDQTVPSIGSEPETMAVTVIDAKSVKLTTKRSGKLAVERVQTVSADARTLTIHYTEYPPRGGPVRVVLTHSRSGAAPAGAHAVAGLWRLEKVDVQSDTGMLITFQSTVDGLIMSSPMGDGYTAKFDGRAVPVKNDPNGGTIAINRIDANTFEETYSVKGKPLKIHRYTVHGNQMTIAATYVEQKATSTFAAERVTTPQAQTR